MITDFIKTTRPHEELRHALDVIREFKACENTQEWMEIPFVAWAKLEQLEEFLDHRVNGTALKEDTIEYMRSET